MKPLQAAVGRGAIAGAVVLVADAEGNRWTQAVGMADVADDLPMTTDALFWAASALSKPLTATAAMLLVDEGRLDLDSPLVRYLPELCDQVGSITTRQCLSHTSGLPFASELELTQPDGGQERFAGTGFAGYYETGDDSVYDGLSLRDAAMSYAETSLLSAPGTCYLYSNAGFNLVGRLIEVLSGEPYASFVDSRLLQPLGLRDTTLWPSESQLARLAKSYASASADGLGRTPLREVPFPQLTAPYSSRARRASPSGGYFSTARDCARFGRMVLRGGELDGQRHLSAAAIAEMTTDQTGGQFNYGLGWRLRPADRDDEASGGFGHSGAMGAGLYLHPPTSRLTVLMVHQDGGCDYDDWWFKQRHELLRAQF